MKVIDLLNKIAKGEEVPKKIKYDGMIFDYQEDTYEYLCYEENNFSLLGYDNPYDMLNDNVEIISEKKEIEYVTLFGEKVKNGSTVNWLNEPNENEKKLASCIDGIAIFVNDLADVINDMRDKE